MTHLRAKQYSKMLEYFFRLNFLTAQQTHICTHTVNVSMDYLKWWKMRDVVLPVVFIALPFVACPKKKKQFHYLLCMVERESVNKSVLIMFKCLWDIHWRDTITRHLNAHIYAVRLVFSLFYFMCSIFIAHINITEGCLMDKFSMNGEQIKFALIFEGCTCPI